MVTEISMFHVISRSGVILPIPIRCARERGKKKLSCIVLFFRNMSLYRCTYRFPYTFTCRFIYAFCENMTQFIQYPESHVKSAAYTFKRKTCVRNSLKYSRLIKCLYFSDLQLRLYGLHFAPRIII